MSTSVPNVPSSRFSDASSLTSRQPKSLLKKTLSFVRNRSAKPQHVAVAESGVAPELPPKPRVSAIPWPTSPVKPRPPSPAAVTPPASPARLPERNAPVQSMPSTPSMVSESEFSSVSDGSLRARAQQVGAQNLDFFLG